MSEPMRIFFIISACLVVLGVLACVIGYSGNRLVENTHEVKDSFESISLETITANVAFLPSESNTVKVVCCEKEKVQHAVSVKDGVLHISAVDERKWYEHISLFSFKTPTVTVYLPGISYDALTVKTGTGDVNILQGFTFESMDIVGSTGDVTIAAKVNGNLCIKISTGDVNINGSAQSLFVKTSTGDISVQNAEVGTVDLGVSTGRVNVASLQCAGEISLRVSTGKSQLSNVTCKSLKTTGSTGDVMLENVIASEKFTIERSTGDVRFDGCDAAEIFVKTDTGNVKGTFLTQKIVFAETDTGSVDIPHSTSGGRCEIKTDTGDIHIEIKE